MNYDFRHNPERLIYETSPQIKALTTATVDNEGKHTRVKLLRIRAERHDSRVIGSSWVVIRSELTDSLGLNRPNLYLVFQRCELYRRTPNNSLRHWLRYCFKLTHPNRLFK